jgi:hypothetical protein
LKSGPDIGDQQVEGSLAGKHLHCIVGIARIDDDIARVEQRERHISPHPSVVFEQQDRRHA